MSDASPLRYSFPLGMALACDSPCILGMKQSYEFFAAEIFAQRGKRLPLSIHGTHADALAGEPVWQSSLERDSSGVGDKLTVVVRWWYC